MKKAVFVSGTDKLDILIYIATIIQGVGKNIDKRCLVVDFTDMQKARYVIPAIELSGEKPEKYVVTHQDIDLAVGYRSYEELMNDNIISTSYEYVFFNVDNPKSLNSIPISSEDMVFLFTTFDIYSIEKARESFLGYNGQNPVFKIFMARKTTKYHEEYVNYLFSNLNISFGDYRIDFPYDNGDISVIYENQRAGRLELKPFSKDFKRSLHDLAEFIGSKENGLGKYMKELEKY